jgi:hypothetical protein
MTEKGFHFGGEIESAADVAIEEGSDARSIPGKQQSVMMTVPKGNGELSVEVVDEILSVLLIEMNDNLGVGMGIEAVSLPLQFGAQFQIVENFTIEDDLDAFVFVVYRLIASCQIDNAESGMGQAYRTLAIVSVAVRATVMNRMYHALEFSSGGGNAATEIDDACYATHILFLASVK